MKTDIRIPPRTDFLIVFQISAAAVFIKSRVACVVILAVKLISRETQAFTFTIKVQQNFYRNHRYPSLLCY